MRMTISEADRLALPDKPEALDTALEAMARKLIKQLAGLDTVSREECGYFFTFEGVDVIVRFLHAAAAQGMEKAANIVENYETDRGTFLGIMLKEEVAPRIRSLKPTGAA